MPRNARCILGELNAGSAIVPFDIAEGGSRFKGLTNDIRMYVLGVTNTRCLALGARGEKRDRRVHCSRAGERLSPPLSRLSVFQWVKNEAGVAQRSSRSHFTLEPHLGCVQRGGRTNGLAGKLRGSTSNRWQIKIQCVNLPQ